MPMRQQVVQVQTEARNTLLQSQHGANTKHFDFICLQQLRGGRVAHIPLAAAAPQRQLQRIQDTAQHMSMIVRCPLHNNAAEPEAGASRTYCSQRLRRSASFSAYETLHGVWTAKDVIQSAGYPMEPHIVTTSDGYIMQMERIPRRGEKYADMLDGQGVTALVL